ncbi:MAG: hypothetical protein ABFC21_09745 [Rectinema sp.]
MSGINNVAIATTKTFLPIEEMVVSLIGKDIEGAFGNGSRFWGVLVNADDAWLYIKGYKGQAIVVKRSKLTALMEVV